MYKHAQIAKGTQVYVCECECVCVCVWSVGCTSSSNKY